MTPGSLQTLRSVLFNIVFFIGTSIGLLLMFPAIVLPRRATMWAARQLATVMLGLLGAIVGLRFELRGDAARLQAPALIACKHQSAWDTFIFYLIARDPAYVMKKELMLIPVYGWLAAKQKMIAVDRKAGASALRRMIQAARDALAAGRQIVIFPQGTRVAPGTHRAYQPGVAALYAQLQQPVVPIALNSGLFWGRRSFTKLPGTIIIEVLPEIPAGLKRAELMRELESRIEAASARLEAEGRAALAAGS
jgi:1-acyl-sn-glycerol-3-phosphate acyltransferase